MKLHNTLSGTIDELRPLEGDTVKLYTCGLTVYSQPHIGNWVAYVYWDILQRALLAHEYQVVRVQNITDVGHLTDDGDDGEDKMEKGARREGKTAWDIAEHYIQVADHEGYEQLCLLRPEHMPRATDFIPQQIAFLQELEKKGYTYQISDGVYFDTSKLDNYGELARLDKDGLQAGARVADSGKKNPTDFALWKFSPNDAKRDMEWDSPWGKGFPGWHLECSVMARELLGDQIDIHTGGIDHIPVHHTNEIAQTEAVTGVQFSQLWVHANHLKVDGKKMSKSLGNIYTLADITEHGFDIQAFKLLVLSKHYRTEGNFTWDILAAAQNRLAHWRAVAELRWQLPQTNDNEEGAVKLRAVPGLLKEIIGNDLDTPAVLAKIDTVFSEIDNHTLSAINRIAFTTLFESIDELLGLQLLDSTPDISDEQKQRIIERQRAREDKDWEASDVIRDELLEQGIYLRDTSERTIWSKQLD